MRLKTIELEAFRVFADSQHLDLNADVVLLSGRNGFGKTCVFDGISWCLFGSSKRFEGSRDFRRAGASFVTNAFRTPGEERVRLTIDATGAEIMAERRGNHLSLFDGHKSYERDRAQMRLLELLGFHPKPDESLQTFCKRARDSFSRSLLLHQDFLSDFVTSTNPRDRFDAFADLFSLTPIREFYTHLSSERSRAHDLRESAARQADIASAELSQLRRQHTSEQTRTDRITENLGEVSRQQANDYVRRSRQALDQVREMVPDFGEGEAPSLDVLDRATMGLSRVHSELESTLSQIYSLRERLPLLTAWEREHGDLLEQIHAADPHLKSARSNATSSQTHLTQLQRSLDSLINEIEAAEAAGERLNAFLSDAAQLVESDECPVCHRPIRRETLIAQLREHLEREDPKIQDRVRQRRSLQDELRAAENDRRRATAELRQAEQSNRELVARANDLARSMQGLRDLLTAQIGIDIPENQAQTAIDQRARQLEDQSRRATEVQQVLDDVRPALEVTDTRERLSQLQQDTDAQARLLAARRETLENYRKVEASLESFILASRRAERSVVQDFVANFREPIQKAYRWLSPHPLFTQLDFDFGEFAEAGELYFEVSHSRARLNPTTAFSAAQANALALAVFLSLNATQDWCPLSLALIDDPVQNFDDLNVLRLVDLIRNKVGDRQILLSTSVPHFYRLLRDKLRPRGPNEQLITHHFEAVTEEGPLMKMDVQRYSPPPRALPELIRLSA